MNPPTPPEARARECDCIYYDTENGNARFIEYSAYQNMRRERDEALSVTAAIEEQAKKNSAYDDWRVEKLEAELSELTVKNAYLQKNYADAKADVKIALEQRERYKRALEYAKRCVTHNEDRAEIERILRVDAKERKR